MTPDDVPEEEVSPSDNLLCTRSPRSPRLKDLPRSSTTPGDLWTPFCELAVHSLGHGLGFVGCGVGLYMYVSGFMSRVAHKRTLNRRAHLVHNAASWCASRLQTSLCGSTHHFQVWPSHKHTFCMRADRFSSHFSIFTGMRTGRLWDLVLVLCVAFIFLGRLRVCFSILLYRGSLLSSTATRHHRLRMQGCMGVGNPSVDRPTEEEGIGCVRALLGRAEPCNDFDLCLHRYLLLLATRNSGGKQPSC